MTDSKKCDTSTRVFQTMLMLKDKPLSIHDITKHFGNNYTPEVFLKYINTLKYLGINIVKIQNKYTILNYPPYIELNDEEISGLKLLTEVPFPDNISKAEIQNFLLELEKHLTEITKDKLYEQKILQDEIEENNKVPILLEKLENYYIKRNELKIFLNDDTYFTGYPIDITYENNKIIYIIFSKKQGKKYAIDITKIKYIEILSDNNAKFKENNTIKTSITFLLKDRLARSYKLKEGEEMIDKRPDGSIVIKNNYEPENLLIRRLLRYEDLCEIISPIQTKDAMKKMLDNMIKLYEN